MSWNDHYAPELIVKIKEVEEKSNRSMTTFMK